MNAFSYSTESTGGGSLIQIRALARRLPVVAPVGRHASLGLEQREPPAVALEDGTRFGWSQRQRERHRHSSTDRGVSAVASAARDTGARCLGLTVEIETSRRAGAAGAAQPPPQGRIARE